MQFLKQILAVILGFFISVGLFFLCIIVIAAIAGSSSDAKPVLSNSVLVLDFKEDIVEYDQKTVIEDFDFEEEEDYTLPKYLKAISKAKNDEKIKGISIKNLSGIQSLTQLHALRKALEDFKTSKKFIYAYNNDGYSQYSYLFNTVADSIFTNHLGTVEMTGFNQGILYYKDFEDKYGIKYEVFRHGKYKSAVEPFLENQMSDNNREQIKTYLLSLWNSYAEIIRQERHISAPELEKMTDSFVGRKADLALKHNLIDGILFKDEYEALLMKKTNTKELKDLHYIGIEDYVKHVKPSLDKKKDADNIAVIYAQGTILDGKSSPKTIGDETIIAALRKAREDKKTKAIVLAINSPGGSGSASELIHREIEVTKKTVPVYASMGDYAASGGYYIACNSNRIFANKETITGSIGVFGTILNVAKAVNELGIKEQDVTTHAHSEIYSVTDEVPDNFRKIVTESIEDFYKLFVNRVAEGRQKSFADIDSIAQGRVWTGADAIKIGLVDEIGTLDDAIAYAVKENNIKEYNIVSYPKVEGSLSDMLQQALRKRAKTEVKELIKEEIGEDAYRELQKLKQNSLPRGIQAIAPHRKFKI